MNGGELWVRERPTGQRLLNGISDAWLQATLALQWAICGDHH